MSEFKSFSIGEVFDIATPAKKFNANTVKFGGKHPYVTRGESNNGIRGYIMEAEKFLNPANTISFGQDTATMFYQNTPYFTGDKIKIFTLKGAALTREISMYLIAVMKKAFSTFSWGRSSFDVNVLKTVKIALPVTAQGNIDYAFMTSQIRELEIARIRQLEAYLAITNLSDYKLTSEEQEFIENHRIVGAKYKPFKIGEIFDIFTGRDVIIGRTSDGEIPLISHQHDNNGIAKYIEKLADRRLFDAAKTIALADRGVFWASVQNKDFHIGTRVKALVFKDGGKSREVRLFLATAINRLQALFAEYLTNATDSLPQLSIQLPTNGDGNPDYEYMNTLICIQQKLAIKNMVEWKDHELVAYQSVVAG